LVILLLDISKGIKQTDINYLKLIEDKKLFIVLNKLDTIEDDDIDTQKNKIQQEIKQVYEDDFTIMEVASKKALAGYLRNDLQRVKDSNFNKLLNHLQKEIKTTAKKMAKIKEKIANEYHNSYKIFLDEYKKTKRIYKSQIYNDSLIGTTTKAQKEIDKIIEEYLFVISNFEYFDKYPSTFFGNFDDEEFSKALKPFEKLSNKIDNLSLEKICKKEIKRLEGVEQQLTYESNIIEELLSKPIKNKLDIRIFDNASDINPKIHKELLEYLLDLYFELSIEQSLIEASFLLISSQLSSITNHITSTYMLLMVFYMQEKKKSWANTIIEDSEQELQEIGDKAKDNLNTLSKELIELSEKIEKTINSIQNKEITDE